MYEDNIEYARQRLNGTIVRVGEEPLYVDKVIDKNTVVGYFLRNMDAVVETRLEALNLEPVPLGYVNYNKGAYYTVRKPMRRDWRQGLRVGNMAFIGDRGFANFPYTDIRNTILGNYPSVAKVVETVQQKTCRMAFSRTFALDNDFQLWYKGRVVGSYNKLFTLLPEYKYLQEHLVETVYA